MKKRIIGTLLMAVGLDAAICGTMNLSFLGLMGGTAVVVVGLFISLYDEL